MGLSRAAGLASCLFLGGCGSFGEGVVAFQQGWRQAKIVEIGAAHQLTLRGQTDCRDEANPIDRRSQFAVLDYRVQSRRHRHIVVFDSTSGAVVGDIVYTNVLECGAPFKVLGRGLP